MQTTSPTAAGRIASDVTATETLPSRGTPTTNAETTASTAVVARMTSSNAIACHAFTLSPSALYHGRKSATSITTPPIAAAQSPLLSRRGSTPRRLTDSRAGFALQPGRFDRVDEQHRDRHRADPTRHRRDGRSLLRHAPEVAIAAKPLVGAVDADVDHHGTVPHHLRGHELRLAYRRDE